MIALLILKSLKRTFNMDRFCIDRDFSLSVMFSRQSRIDTLNLHIWLGKKEGKCVDDLIELRQRRYLI